MFDFIRVSTAVPNISVCDVDYNANEIITMVQKNKDADVIVFPELSLTGYTCGDLFFQKELLKSVKVNLNKILTETKNIKSVIAVGAPIVIEGKLYNCAVMLCNGRIFGIYTKTNVVNSGGLYEGRWFSSATDIKTPYISSLELGLNEDYAIPVGNDLIFNLGGYTKIGAEIGTDLNLAVSPSTGQCLNGAEVIVNLAASCAVINERKSRVSFIKHKSELLKCAYAYASAGESESTTDSVYSGRSVICKNGTVLKENSKVTDNGYSIKTDIDLGKIKAERLKNNSSSILTGKIDSREIYIDVKPDCDGSLYEVDKLVFVPSSKQERTERCLEIFDIQVAGLKKRIQKTGAKMVLGVSGGLDSTLTILICVETARQLGLPADSVIGITLPCFGTTKRTHSNAWMLMESLGVRSLEIDIKEACTQHCKDIGHPENLFNTTYENIQARERTQVLMDFACKEGGMVIGTGDLSELALGWCTYNADHMSMYSTNSGVPKTLIRWIILSLIENGRFAQSADVLRDIIDTPISPELLPPDEKGNIAQQTEEIIGPYALHDFFLYYFFRYSYSPSKIYFLAQKAFKNDFDDKTILKWLEVFYKRFFTQQFKRSCLPDGVKIGSVSLSPRSDLKIPSDASYNLWLKEIESLKK